MCIHFFFHHCDHIKCIPHSIETQNLGQFLKTCSERQKQKLLKIIFLKYSSYYQLHLYYTYFHIQFRVIINSTLNHALIKSIHLFPSYMTFYSERTSPCLDGKNYHDEDGRAKHSLLN